MAASVVIASLLTDSSRSAADYLKSLNVQGLGEVRRLNGLGKRSYAAGEYSQAHGYFLSAVAEANRIGDRHDVALNWNNAGSSSVHALQYRPALEELTRARQFAESAHELRVLSFTFSNLMDLYLHEGTPEKAIPAASEALRELPASVDPVNRAKLQCQLGAALMRTGKLADGIASYREGINGLTEAGDFASLAIVWSLFGDDSDRAGNTADAERAYLEGIRVEWMHGRTLTPDLLSGLASVMGRNGDRAAAETLFHAALNAPPGAMPVWRVHARRGQFNLDAGRLSEALADFRQAREIASRLRADMVPADLDRVGFENGLSHFLEGIIDAGNRLALQNGDRNLLVETFDAAEQDRLWSLRALVPSANDWREHLPESYWDLLARYQAAERRNSPDAAQLEDQLRQIEIRATGDSPTPAAGSALAHVRETLDSQSVLISFHISKTSSWVWATSGNQIDAYPLPPAATIETDAASFSAAVRSGNPSEDAGARLYRDLFGAIPARYLGRVNWRLELDGPLYDVPFPALVIGRMGDKPVYLIEKASVESVPGALLLARGAISADGGFLGIGDPVYNSADPRYHGSVVSSGISLPRLPNTAGELEACARSWKSNSTTILAGPEAGSSGLAAAIAGNPQIVHFATHVVSDRNNYKSGLIALSLTAFGTLDLLGPKEIVAHRSSAKLVVMNGCHSAQGQSFAGAGLMGLTRAWIGAGASAVIATQWDVPDAAAQGIMSRFYAALHSMPEQGLATALRRAELDSLAAGQTPASWAAYSLLSRIP